jgi:hypothetical protein
VPAPDNADGEHRFVDQATHNKIVSFIWGIADDVLHDLFKRGKYPDAILPMCVIRRMDAVLEPTKGRVLKSKRMLDWAGITGQRAALCAAAGQAFYNTSRFTLRDLRSRGSPQQLLADFEDYLNGFSPKVQVFARRRLAAQPPNPCPNRTAADLEPFLVLHKYILWATICCLPGSIPAALGGELLFPLDCMPNDSMCYSGIGYPDIDGDGRAFDCNSPGYTDHEGTDIGIGWAAMNDGVSVLAAADGIVLWVFDGKFDRCPDPSMPDCQAPPSDWGSPGQSQGYRVCTEVGPYCGTGGFGCYWCFDGGNVVVIRHPEQPGIFATRYDHLKQGSITVSPGDQVSRGQRIADVGSSGNSTGPHLHFEVWDRGFYKPADPWAGPCGPNYDNPLWMHEPPWEPHNLRIRDASNAERQSGTSALAFKVTLSPPSTGAVTVKYATANGTALAGSDYAATGGTLTFSPGQTSKTVAVNAIGDTAVEPNETFLVNLSAPTGATLLDSQGRGTIVNDDGPVIVVSDLSKAEGNAGTASFAFKVTLSPPSTGTVKAKYASANGTALAGSDYAATSGTLTFWPGQTNKTVAVNATGDTAPEPNETFLMNLSASTGATLFDSQGLGTIVNDEGPVLRINDVSKAEGDSGTNAAHFTVSLSQPSIGAVTVKYATANGTALAGSDYAATGGTLTFSPGQTRKTVAVSATGDTAAESDETFVVNLSAPTGATLFDGQGRGTIVDDDGPSE